MDPQARAPLQRRAAAALIAAVVVAAFLPALQGEWLNWDDDLNFTTNPAYRGLCLTQLHWMWTTFLMGHFHPVTWMTLGADYIVWGMNPFGYHLSSLLFHAANTVLLFFVLLRLLALTGRPGAVTACALGALLHGLHPLRVESVAWITERRDVVCGFFFLLAVLFYLRRVEEERAGRPSARWLALSAAAFAASLLSKALGIMLPAVLLLLDLHPLGRFTPGSRRKILAEKALFGAIAAADLVLQLLAVDSIHNVHSLRNYRLLDRAAQAAFGPCFYLLKTLWPADLIPIYRIDEPIHPGDLKYVAAMFGIVAATTVLVLQRRRFPGLLTAWLSMLALLLPVLGVAVTGFQIAADRYTYLSFLPAAALAAWGLEGCASPASTARRVVVPACLGLLAVLSALTWRQCGIWRTSFTLWDRVIAVDPGNFLAFSNRGFAKFETGDIAGAIRDYDRALELRPSHEKTWNNRALARDRIGDVDGALQDYDRALFINPQYALPFTNRGSLRLRLGDADGALSDAEEALKRDPEGGGAYVVRGSVRRARGDLAGAEADLDRAVSRTPLSIEAWNNRAVLRVRMARYPEAIADFDRALSLKPDHAVLRMGRGQARLLGGDPAGAAADFETVLRQTPPDWPYRKDVETLLQRTRAGSR
ncbi:MAG TPA: tetratricopeptide repeat protein [Planctomycetota bacterium]|nr:tetratricopeptide repeat protein [Planctomycetota bacterium]